MFIGIGKGQMKCTTNQKMMIEVKGVDIDKAFKHWKESGKGLSKSKFLKEVGMSFATYGNYKKKKGNYQQLTYLANLARVSGLSEEELKITKEIKQ